MNILRLQALLAAITRRNDIALAVALVAVIFVMILPLPTPVVDALIATNMGISVILLMVAVYIPSPLHFSAFPAVLLLTAIFRLALSITTTRLILLQADAGQIVFTFGNFVVAGNLIVGAVIFLIITIVQFLVITKGAERVAEVSARFSLDAMPGKQMSIDGDMRAGVIDMEEAHRRRAMVEKESQLYGSMDGAMKFVKGDAIAGLIIIVVNIIGGVSIGTLQRDLSVGEALQTYSILTVGDGLISQIPALFIAITAGIIVTRVTTEDSTNLGSDIGEQIEAQPKALLIGGALLLGFALIPGFPSEIFVGLALVVLGFGYIFSRARAAVVQVDEGAVPAMAAATQPPARAARRRLNEPEEFALTVPLLIDVAADLEETIKAEELNDALALLRRALYLDLGVPFPGIHLRFNENLPRRTYVILIQEVPMAQGVLRPGHVLARDQTDSLDLLSIPYETDEPFVPDLPTVWVEEAHVVTMRKAGAAFMAAPEVLTYHLSFILKKYAEDFIGIQETRYLLEQMEGSFSELVKEVQRILPIQKITEVFQRLVSEQISIRNLRVILEAMVEWGQKEKDVVLLTEYIRGSLKRYISYKFSSGNNMLPAYLLDPDVEDMIRNGIRQTSGGSYLALDPEVSQQFVRKVVQTVGDISRHAHKPTLITSMDIRRYVRKLIELDLYALPVLSYQELTQEITIQPLSRIDLH